MKKILFIKAAALLFLCACNQPAPEKRVAVRPSKLHGRWESVYLKIEMPTYRNSDSTKVIEVHEANWEQALGIRPMLYFFWPDSTYNILHYDLRDSLVLNPAGEWRLDIDTLSMWDVRPRKGEVYKYKLTIQGNMAELRGMEDADNDGQKDDLYYATFRKFERQ